MEEGKKEIDPLKVVRHLERNGSERYRLQTLVTKFGATRTDMKAILDMLVEAKQISAQFEKSAWWYFIARENVAAPPSPLSYRPLSKQYITALSTAHLRSEGR